MSPTHLPQELLRSQEQQIVAEERLSNLEEHNKSETMQLQVHKMLFLMTLLLFYITLASSYDVPFHS